MSNITEKIIGMTEEQADKAVTKAGLRMRVMRRDAESFIRTMDFDPRTVNVTIISGRVTEASRDGNLK